MAVRLMRAIVTVAAFLAAGCAAAPPYVRPQVPVPTAYKENQAAGGDQLQPARPSDRAGKLGNRRGTTTPLACQGRRHVSSQPTLLPSRRVGMP